MDKKKKPKKSSADGTTHIKPPADIQEKNRWLYDDPELIGAVLAGIKEASEGKLVSMGSFAKYADEELD